MLFGLSQDGKSKLTSIKEEELNPSFSSFSLQGKRS
jgi:hypothetical protein